MSGVILTAKENPFKDNGTEDVNQSLDFAVKWNYSDKQNYALEQVGDNKDFTFYPLTSSFKGVSSFDSYYPWKGMRICYLSPEGEVVAYEGEPGFEWTPEAGDIMVEIPKFYYGIEVDEENKFTIFHISNEPKDGYYVSPRHHKFGDMKNDFDKIYVSAYNVNYDCRSISGTTSANRQGRLQTQLTRGTVPGYYQMDYLTMLTVELLRIVETAHLRVDYSLTGGLIGALNTPYYTGTHNSCFHSGRDASNIGDKYRYRYLDYFAVVSGNGCQAIQGIYLKDGKAYIGYNPTQISDDYEQCEVIINYPYDGHTNANGMPEMLSYLSGVTRNNPDAKYQDWTAFIPSSTTRNSEVNSWPGSTSGTIFPASYSITIGSSESSLIPSFYSLPAVDNNSSADNNYHTVFQRLLYLPPEK